MGNKKRKRTNEEQHKKTEAIAVAMLENCKKHKIYSYDRLRNMGRLPGTPLHCGMLKALNHKVTGTGTSRKVMDCFYQRLKRNYYVGLEDRLKRGKKKIEKCFTCFCYIKTF